MFLTIKVTSVKLAVPRPQMCSAVPAVQLKKGEEPKQAGAFPLRLPRASLLFSLSDQSH